MSRQFSGALPAAVGSTATVIGPDQANTTGAAGITVVLDVTSAGTGSLTVFIEGKDRASGKYVTLLAGGAVTTASTNVYRVFPLSAVVANVSANASLPEIWRLRIVANNANPTSWTCGWSLT